MFKFIYLHKPCPALLIIQSSEKQCKHRGPGHDFNTNIKPMPALGISLFFTTIAVDAPCWTICEKVTCLRSLATYGNSTSMFTPKNMACVCMACCFAMLPYCCMYAQISDSTGHGLPKKN